MIVPPRGPLRGFVLGVAKGRSPAVARVSFRLPLPRRHCCFCNRAQSRHSVRDALKAEMGSRADEANLVR